MLTIRSSLRKLKAQVYSSLRVDRHDLTLCDQGEYCNCLVNSGGVCQVA